MQPGQSRSHWSHEDMWRLCFRSEEMEKAKTEYEEFSSIQTIAEDGCWKSRNETKSTSTNKHQIEIRKLCAEKAKRNPSPKTPLIMTSPIFHRAINWLFCKYILNIFISKKLWRNYLFGLSSAVMRPQEQRSSTVQFYSISSKWRISTRQQLKRLESSGRDDKLLALLYSRLKIAQNSFEQNF